MRHSSTSRRFVPAGLMIMCAVLAGCASNASTNGDPGARPLPPGSTCQSLKGEMDGLVRRGVSSSIEARQSGRKISPQQSADADRYNQLLNDYLGARCHA